MITINKQNNRIGFDSGDLVYLGKDSKISQTELDSDNGVFFDTNNIKQFVEKNDDNNVKTTGVSFINGAKFYTCKTDEVSSCLTENAGLCFRCVTNCQYCDNCVKCVDSCNGCVNCTACNGCIDGCDICVNCNGCTACINCIACFNGCRDGIDSCSWNCWTCQICNGCASCTGCAGCTSYVGPGGGCQDYQGSNDVCRDCNSTCYKCTSCYECVGRCVGCVNNCYSYY